MALDKQYDPKSVEAKWAQFWERGGLFKADAHSQKPPYTIVMPPPNVTGRLHMGHALVTTLQDILIRWKRMLGYEALWLPGCDHAGIATQTVVERHLMATEGKRRQEYTREEFLARVYSWKEEKEETIQGQLKALGASCDWSRYRFTMDEQASRAVRHFFKRLYEADLIYQGDYLVNWDPVTQTALADDEVEYVERKTVLWHVRYPLIGEKGEIIIATTRPETIPADTAIAVHPEDKRYHHLIGKKVRVPMTRREIPIIGDPYVDPTFGSGALKVTPAHDPNDWQIGQRHNLEVINLLTQGAYLNENGGPLKGLSVDEAREEAGRLLKEGGNVVMAEPYHHRVGLSYRSKAVIEPYLSKQWFISMEGFKKRLHTAVSEGKVALIPESWRATYFHWIDNLRDWCISRQLWWGHQIPIWHHKKTGEKLCYAGEGLPPEVEKHPGDWTQDPDALDTWFSSALWPLTTLGWPDKNPDLEKFYPTSVLVTGHDILFFWVARMILAGEYLHKEPPFPEAFVHGLIYGKSYWRVDPKGGIDYITGDERRAYDEGRPLPKDVHSKWEKLSKSKGNVIDPLEIIAEYGTDAMRMALCASSPQNAQIDLDRRRFEEFKNFANKIWNGARFVLMNTEGLSAKAFAHGLDLEHLRLEDKWILSTLARVATKVDGHLKGYAFDQAAMAAYDFFWKEFCAYYVEICKPVLFGKTGTAIIKGNQEKLLLIVLCQAVRLLAPMAPFITEELFAQLKERLGSEKPHEGQDPFVHECLTALQSEACATAPYPTLMEASAADDIVDNSFEWIQKLIYTVRNIRGEMGLPPGLTTDLYIIGASDSPDLALIEEHGHLIPALLKVDTVHLVEEAPQLPFASAALLDGLTLLVPLPEEHHAQERSRLEKHLAKLTQNQNNLKQKLDSAPFIERAPQELVENTRATLSQLEREIAEIESKLK
ncbi:MAG: valine--tRNA ligase [Parachlamydiales bacterium]